MFHVKRFIKGYFVLVIVEIFLLETLVTRVILCKLASVTWRKETGL